MFELSFLTRPSDNLKNQILSLYHAQKWWPESITETDRVQRAIQGSHCFLAAMSGDELAGMGRALSDKTGDAYIHDVTVKEKFRRKGLGTLIINTLIGRLKQDGITWVALIAEKNSHPFYIQDGFQVMENAVPLFKWI